MGLGWLVLWLIDRYRALDKSPAAERERRVSASRRQGLLLPLRGRDRFFSGGMVASDIPRPPVRLSTLYEAAEFTAGGGEGDFDMFDPTRGSSRPELP